MSRKLGSVLECYGWPRLWLLIKVNLINTGFVDFRVGVEWVMVRMVIVLVRVCVRAERVRLLMGFDCVVIRVRIG